MSERVGFVGLGTMGGGIATQLIEHGFHVAVHDRSPEAVERLTARGAESAGSAAEASDGSEYLGVCVVNDAQAEDVLFGTDGALRAANPARYLLMHSTISPETCVALGQRCAERGVTLLDAPISGARLAAAAGELTVYAGGESATIEACRAYLEAMSARVVHAGPVGAGQVAKVVNNVVAILSQVAAGESVRLGRASGLTTTDVIDYAKAGTGRCWAVENWASYWGEGMRSAAAGLKDLTIASDMAIASGISLPFVDAIRETMADLAAAEAAREVSDEDESNSRAAPTPRNPVYE